MELGQARAFARQRKELEIEIGLYEPGVTEHEGMPHVERFDRLWTEFDALASLAPSYDGINRDQLTVKDRDGISLTVTRSQQKTERRMKNINIRTITAEWSSTDGILFTESLEDELIRNNFNDWVTHRLGVLEETEAAVRDMIEQHKARMEYARNHPISEGHG